jgi:hypothetical protein
MSGLRSRSRSRPEASPSPAPPEARKFSYLDFLPDGEYLDYMPSDEQLEKTGVPLLGGALKAVKRVTEASMGAARELLVEGYLQDRGFTSDGAKTWGVDDGAASRGSAEDAQRRPFAFGSLPLPACWNYRSHMEHSLSPDFVRWLRKKVAKNPMFFGGVGLNLLSGLLQSSPAGDEGRAALQQMLVWLNTGIFFAFLTDTSGADASTQDAGLSLYTVLDSQDFRGYGGPRPQTFGSATYSVSAAWRSSAVVAAAAAGAAAGGPVWMGTAAAAAAAAAVARRAGRGAAAFPAAPLGAFAEAALRAPGQVGARAPRRRERSESPGWVARAKPSMWELAHLQGLVPAAFRRSAAALAGLPGSAYGATIAAASAAAAHVGVPGVLGDVVKAATATMNGVGFATGATYNLLRNSGVGGYALGGYPAVPLTVPMRREIGEARAAAAKTVRARAASGGGTPSVADPVGEAFEHILVTAARGTEPKGGRPATYEDMLAKTPQELESTVEDQELAHTEMVGSFDNNYMQPIWHAQRGQPVMQSFTSLAVTLAQQSVIAGTLYALVNTDVFLAGMQGFSATVGDERSPNSWVQLTERVSTGRIPLYEGLSLAGGAVLDGVQGVVYNGVERAKSSIYYQMGLSDSGSGQDPLAGVSAGAQFGAPVSGILMWFYQYVPSGATVVGHLSSASTALASGEFVGQQGFGLGPGWGMSAAGGTAVAPWPPAAAAFGESLRDIAKREIYDLREGAGIPDDGSDQTPALPLDKQTAHRLLTCIVGAYEPPDPGVDPDEECRQALQRPMTSREAAFIAASVAYHDPAMCHALARKTTADGLSLACAAQAVEKTFDLWLTEWAAGAARPDRFAQWAAEHEAWTPEAGGGGQLTVDRAASAGAVWFSAMLGRGAALLSFAEPTIDLMEACVSKIGSSAEEARAGMADFTEAGNRATLDRAGAAAVALKTVAQEKEELMLRNLRAIKGLGTGPGPAANREEEIVWESQISIVSAAILAYCTDGEAEDPEGLFQKQVAYTMNTLEKRGLASGSTAVSVLTEMVSTMTAYRGWGIQKLLPELLHVPAWERINDAAGAAVTAVAPLGRAVADYTTLSSMFTNPGSAIASQTFGRREESAKSWHMVNTNLERFAEERYHVDAKDTTYGPAERAPAPEKRAERTEALRQTITLMSRVTFLNTILQSAAQLVRHTLRPAERKDGGKSGVLAFMRASVAASATGAALEFGIKFMALTQTWSTPLLGGGLGADDRPAGVARMARYLYDKQKYEAPNCGPANEANMRVLEYTVAQEARRDGEATRKGKMAHVVEKYFKISATMDKDAKERVEPVYNLVFKLNRALMDAHRLVEAVDFVQLYDQGSDKDSERIARAGEFVLTYEEMKELYPMHAHASMTDVEAMRQIHRDRDAWLGSGNILFTSYTQALLAALKSPRNTEAHIPPRTDDDPNQTAAELFARDQGIADAQNRSNTQDWTTYNTLMGEKTAEEQLAAQQEWEDSAAEVLEPRRRRALDRMAKKMYGMPSFADVQQLVSHYMTVVAVGTTLAGVAAKMAVGSTSGSEHTVTNAVVDHVAATANACAGFKLASSAWSAAAGKFLTNGEVGQMHGVLPPFLGIPSMGARAAVEPAAAVTFGVAAAAASRMFSNTERHTNLLLHLRGKAGSTRYSRTKHDQDFDVCGWAHQQAGMAADLVAEYDRTAKSGRGVGAGVGCHAARGRPVCLECGPQSAAYFVALRQIADVEPMPGGWSRAYWKEQCPQKIAAAVEYLREECATLEVKTTPERHDAHMAAARAELSPREAAMFDNMHHGWQTHQRLLD